MPRFARSVLLATALQLLLTASGGAQQSGIAFDAAQGLGGRGIIGASTSIVLDSAVIRSSAARTLADLLSSRVAGINVTYATGAPGFAPEVTTRGGATIVGSARPLLYIDGILQRDDPHALGPLPDGNRPAHAWSLPVEEIESVEVILGAAGGALLEYGTSRGAILVRTRRPVAGRLALRSFIETLALEPGMTFPDIVTTVATTAGGTDPFCTLAREANGLCIPTGTRRWSALGGESPLRTGIGTRAGMSVTGGSRRVSYRLSALGDQGAGQIANSGMDRVDVAASLTGRVRDGLEVSLDARHARSAGKYARWGANGLLDVGANIWQAGGSGDPPDTTKMDSTLAHSLPYETSRTTLGLAASWRVVWGFTVFARIGTDHLTRASGLKEGLLGCVVCFRKTSNHLDQSNTGGTVGIRGARALWTGARVSGEAGAHVSLLDRQESVVDSAWTGTSVSFNKRTSSPDVRSRSLYGAARFDLTPNRFIAGGIRFEHLDISGWGPKFAPLLTAEAGWTVSGERFFPRNVIVPSLRLRAAYGESGDDEATLASLQTLAFVSGPLLERRDRIRSRELGADATIAGGAFGLRATAFDRSVIHANLLAPFGPVSSNSWATHGVELTLRPREFAIGSARWNSALTLATAQSRLTRFTGLTGPPQYWARVQFLEGGPIGTLYTYRYTWADANNDGVIVASEVTPEAALSRRGVVKPDRLLGLTSSLTWRTRVTAGIAIDGKTGHVKADVTRYERCLVSLCRANYDPSTPLAEQAAAVAYALMSPVHDATFVRVRELWVRYALPSGLVPRGLTGASLHFAAHQLATWTKYPSGDPETGAFAEGNVQHWDLYTPRIPRTFSLRLDLVR